MQTQAYLIFPISNFKFRLGRQLLLLLVVLSGWGTTPAVAQPSLGQALKDIEVAEHWIYDDLPKAVAEAKQSGKPLLVVLRCVPCPPGKTLDAAVAMPSPELADIEKQFVCVRVIKTNGLDLDLFQYDYDMSWNAMFLNAADMAIYGRYGTRYSSGAGSDGNLSVDAFQKAAERALALHQNYPAVKASLAAKIGKPVEWKVPEQTPGLTDRQGVAVTKQNCIHCHMIKDFGLRAKWQQGRLTEEDLFVYPAPPRIGLTLDIPDGLIVKTVESGSPAADAGVKVGDVLVNAGGQPLISTADLVWVLHIAPNETSLPVTVSRNGANIDLKLTLSGDWKRGDIAWRGSSWYGLRQGLKTEPMPPPAKATRGLAADAMALEVKGMFGKNAPLIQKAGLKVGDVIVAVDGQSGVMSESEFLVNLRTKHGPKDAIKLTILRGSERQELSVPLW
jgi:hypothetical protein